MPYATFLSTDPPAASRRPSRLHGRRAAPPPLLRQLRLLQRLAHCLLSYQVPRAGGAL